jgi:hypothetical protein
MKKALIVTIFFSLLNIFHNANAATYYVDFDSGNDSNNGVSITTAWRNLPGTCSTATSSSLNCTNLNTHNIAAGDTIEIKAGTTHDSTDGGRIHIASNYYANGTSSSPITIKASTTWGSGQIVIDGTGISLPPWRGLFDIYDRDYIVIDGSVTDGILLRNSNSVAIWGTYTPSSNHTVGWTVKNLKIYNSGGAGLLFYHGAGEASGYAISGIVIDTVNCDTTRGNGDGDGCIEVWYANNVIIQNCTATNACNGVANSCDGIHLGNVNTALIQNNITYNNGEQGIDISKGVKVGRDDVYNILVRNNISYNNYKMNYDANSGARDIYFINNQSKKSYGGESGDGLFSLYQSGERIFFINNTSIGGTGWGYQFSWDGATADMASGSGAKQIGIINSISTGSSYQSVYVSSASSGYDFNLNVYNSNFYSNYSSNEVNIKGSTYTKAQINTGTWGTNCKAVDPLLNNIGGANWSGNLTLQPGSPMIAAGVFPFTTSGSGSGTVVNLSALVAGLDARYVFRAGDSIKIEGVGTYTIASVDSAAQIKLTGSASWSSGMGVWFPWPNQKIDIGAMPSNFLPITLPTEVKTPSGLKIIN